MPSRVIRYLPSFVSVNETILPAQPTFWYLFASFRLASVFIFIGYIIPISLCLVARASSTILMYLGSNIFSGSLLLGKSSAPGKGKRGMFFGNFSIHFSNKNKGCKRSSPFFGKLVLATKMLKN